MLFSKIQYTDTSLQYLQVQSNQQEQTTLMKERLIEKMNSILNSGSKPENVNRPEYYSPKTKIKKQLSIDQEKLTQSAKSQEMGGDGSEFQIRQDCYQDRESKVEYPSLEALGLSKELVEKGESPIFVDKSKVLCKLSLCQYEPVLFIITNFKVAIQPQLQDFTTFPLGKVQRIHKYIDADKAYKIMIQLKDGRRFKFKVVSQIFWRKISEYIQNFSFIKNKKRFFAFRHFQENAELEEKYGGWKIYNPIQEFQRMKITLMSHFEENVDQFSSDFRILDNAGGKICSTYPPVLVVPSRLPYDAIIRCSRFRSKERMPALSFAYEYEKDKFACIYRSSQSKVGVQNSRSSDDEIMLQLIGNSKLNPRSPYYQAESENTNCKIYDARGYYAALGNKISGKGFESEEFYENCKLEFLNIPNIHAVREAYWKTVQASMGEDNKFYVGLAESKWYEFVFLILFGAWDLAKTVHSGINSLVHCSDGWDRTAQLCSLASIILDPYYRTLEGFIVSIEKDWIYFGHQFAKRLGQGLNDPKNQDKSQVFLQFLDCVTQIMYQFPSEFEFNYRFIEQISEQAYSNLYGNFLCNCYQEMIDNQIFTSTVSLWSKLLSQKQLYRNPFFMPSQKNLLSFQANLKNMRFWKEHFLKHVDHFKDVYGIYSCKFTENNLEIMHDHILQEKQLLGEKMEDNESFMSSLDGQLNSYKYSDEFKMETEEIEIDFEMKGIGAEEE